jgi:hypothetical protein
MTDQAVRGRLRTSRGTSNEQDQKEGEKELEKAAVFKRAEGRLEIKAMRR